jgi:hypothetical protein
LSPSLDFAALITAALELESDEQADESPFAGGFRHSNNSAAVVRTIESFDTHRTFVFIASTTSCREFFLTGKRYADYPDI